MKRILSIIAAVLFVASVFAQVPERISYQAVVRNTKGLLIINTQIGMEINIRRSTPTGTIVYTETQTPTTNANGLVSIEIGTGSEFSAIRWGNDTYFIETKTAVEPPLTDYTITGISKLLSVPYALHAKTADSITGPITEADPLYTASQASNITAADLVKLSNLSGVNTGDQDLSSLATTASVTTGLATKVDKVEGKGLSTNDYTTTEQSKLAGIATGAEVNVNADWNATSGDAQILNKPEIANADWNATTGMAQILNKPTIANADWNASSGAAQILNKPTIPTAADLVKLSNLSGVNTGDQDLSSLATTASVTTGLATKVDKVEGKGLSTNDYTTTEQSKLADIATGAEVNVNADWNATSGDAQILNKPEIANADWNATTGMAQILNKPTIANADWNASSGAAQILNKPTIPTAADLVKLSNLSGVNTGDQDLSSLATTSSVTTGLATKVDKVEGKGLSTNDYTTTEQSKLAGIATGAEVNVNADWNATSGDAQILNKPEIANADWNATTGIAQILNKPTIPTAADLVNLSNLSGVNTGDQDLSGLATTASLTTGLATKVDKVEGKGLSTNDYTTTEQSKLAGIATGAEVNVNADWNATSGDAQILNKPEIANADWNATSGIAQILNKPAIPTAADLENLSNLSGVNTGDQDLSGLATTASLTTGLATKVDKVEGKGLSTNDYTTTEQSKLAGIATGAEVNVNADWNATSGDAQILNKPEIANADWNAISGIAQILNKPTIPTAADLVNLSNLSGVNTGDQDLSSLATTASVTTGLATKVDKVEGKGLSTNDYTTTEQSKLAGIATGAEVNVNADWNATSGIAQILNKPTIANADWNATSGAAQILNKPAIPTAADLVNLSNLSGVNTGDQDLSGLATTASVTTGLATKVDKVEGKGLSTNDFTTTEQSKLAGIATGAEVNVNADWNATSGDAQILNKPEIANPDWNATSGIAQILNKPTIPTAADGSETKVTAGTNITVSGTGTTANPYVINGPVSTTLTIGQSYQGGIIFWLDATGQHGLIAATVDQGHLIKWSKNNDRIIGATGNGMYAGAMNTAIIVAALMPEQQTETFAAQLCADYSVTVDGVMYGDWYLPSIYELKLLQQKKDIVGTFIAESYWSSTEYTQTGHPDYPKIMATSLSFSGFQYEPTGDYKYSTSFKNVRAIRAF